NVNNEMPLSSQEIKSDPVREAFFRDMKSLDRKFEKFIPLKEIENVYNKCIENGKSFDPFCRSVDQLNKNIFHYLARVDCQTEEKKLKEFINKVWNNKNASKIIHQQLRPENKSLTPIQY